MKKAKPFMAKEATVAATTHEGGTITHMSQQKRAAQTRKPSAPTEVFAIVQVLDEHGQPIYVRKGSIRVISFERNGIAVLDKVDDQEKYPNALYLRGLLPPGR